MMMNLDKSKLSARSICDTLFFGKYWYKKAFNFVCEVSEVRCNEMWTTKTFI